MKLSEIKIQPIRTASVEYTKLAIELALEELKEAGYNTSNYQPSEDMNNLIHDTFMAGASWVLQLLEFRLQHSIDLKPLYELVKTLKGEK